MSAVHATQESRSGRQDHRKRKPTGTSAAPQPKFTVGGAGQPLDPSVRRELEQRLGHDLGRVRLHTDRDADALCDLLGADAVTAGTDVFFRAGAYHPGTTDGRRLIAHELLHTIQHPYRQGALTAGRDGGAVSLPQEGVERAAESAARDAVQEAPPETVADVEPVQVAPGLLRYATIDADRARTELDPATLPDRLAGNILRTLRGDPADWSKRTRKQLARLPDPLMDPVLDRLQSRLLSPEYDRVLGFVDEIVTNGELDRGAQEAPKPEPDTAEELRLEREAAWRRAAAERERGQRPGPAPGPEKEQYGEPGAAGSTPRNGGVRGDRVTPQGGGVAPGASAPRGGLIGEPTPVGTGPERTAEPGAPSSAKQTAPAAPAAAAAPGAVAPRAEPRAEPTAGEKKAAGAGQTREKTEQQGAPVPSREESAARNRPEAAEALVAGEQIRTEDRREPDRTPDTSSTPGKQTQVSSAISTLDPVRNQDVEGLVEPPSGEAAGLAEKPPAPEPEADAGLAGKSAWDINLQPEDFLPTQDPDLSGVPTADKIDPSSTTAPPMPSFPAPPVTRADQVQAERDAEDAEDQAAGAELEQEPAGPEQPPEVGPEPETPAEPLPERVAGTPPGPGTTPPDPTSGADPKAGPVDAQAAAPGPAARGAQQRTDAAPAGRSEPASDARAPSPARDTHVSGGSNQDTPGGATSAAASGAIKGADHEPPPTPAAPQAPAETEPVAARQDPVVRGASAAPGPRPTPIAPASPAAASPAAAEPAAAEPAAAVKAAPTTPAATPAPRAEGGGGGNPSASAKRTKDSAPAPNLSAVSPEAGLATAAKLKPHRALEAMTGVGRSADRTVGAEHKSLAAAPPSMQRPAGAPRTLEGNPRTDGPARYSQAPAPQSSAPEPVKAEVAGAKQPEGPIAAEKAEEPSGWDTFKMALGFGLGWVASRLGFEVDPQELAAKFAGLPSADEALKQAQAGNIPGVQMSEAADQTSDGQGSAVEAKGQEAVDAGRDDAGRNMGEGQVYPDAPQEQMRASVPGREGSGTAVPDGRAPTGAVPVEAASKVAEHDHGPQTQAAFHQGQTGMSNGRQVKDQGSRDVQTRHKTKVGVEIAGSTKSQAGERDRTLDEVTGQRAGWRQDQDAELKKLGTRKIDRQVKVRQDVQERQKKTDDDVTKEGGDSDKKIRDRATNAEQDAIKKRDDSVKESGNWITQAFDWIKQKVLEIKNAIVGVIKEAREAVVGFIRSFKETVERWVNEAREFIVNTIKQLINDLIEFAKEMVRAIIELANRIRKLITAIVKAAIALVNKLAAMLKQIIKDLLDALGKMLADLLKVLLKALLDVIKAVVDAVKQVMAVASQLLGMLGAFLFIAIDFLSDPGGWLSGAKDSAVDGAKHHLFREVKDAVKQWFQSKIQEILGIGKAVFDALIKGGFSLEKIVQEAWGAIVPMLPFIIGEIVITKVIAKLIPGAGWVMAVIDAIRTAIGSLGAILRAMGAVLTWLLSVRRGGAGLLFAKAVASGVVVLLELAYQALMSGIGKYLVKVGKRLKGIAARLVKGDRGGAPPRTPREGADPGPATRDAPTEPSTRTANLTTTSAERHPALPAERLPGQPAEGVSVRASEPPTGKPGVGPTPPGQAPAAGALRSSPAAAPRKAPPATSKTPDGKPKTADDDIPDTRPTPLASPKPKAEPPPKTEPERPKPQADEAPGRPHEGEPTKPKDTEPTQTPKEPSKPKEPPNAGGRAKPRNGDHNPVPGKPKHPEGGVPKGPKPRKPRGPHDKPRGPHDRRPSEDRPPPRGKPDKKDPKKNPENSGDSRRRRLLKAVARIRRRLRPPMEHGIPRTIFLDRLSGMQRFYRLSGLRPAGGKQFTVTASLVPYEEPVLRGEYSEPHSERNAYTPRAPHEQLSDIFKARWIPRGVKGAFEGDFEKFPENEWAGYAPQKPDGHPANEWVKKKEEPRRENGNIPRLQEKYHTIPGVETPGGNKKRREDWHELIQSLYDGYRKRKGTYGRVDGPADDEARRFVEDLFRKGSADDSVSECYELPYHHLFLKDWTEHHMHPVNWGGGDVTVNLIYIRQSQHQPFTNFFNTTAREIRKDIKDSEERHRMRGGTDG